MTISKVEPDLRQIIQNLRDGNLEKAKDRTVELIESAFRMSGPMYREETTQPGPQLAQPAYPIRVKNQVDSGIDIAPHQAV